MSNPHWKYHNSPIKTLIIEAGNRGGGRNFVRLLIIESLTDKGERVSTIANQFSFGLTKVLGNYHLIGFNPVYCCDKLIKKKTCNELVDSTQLSRCQTKLFRRSLTKTAKHINDNSKSENQEKKLRGKI